MAEQLLLQSLAVMERQYSTCSSSRNSICSLAQGRVELSALHTEYKVMRTDGDSKLKLGRWS